MDEQGASEGYVADIAAHQGQLMAYILSSLGSYADAQDVLQSTNIALWRKAKDFREGAEFLPWAYGVARYEVLQFARKKGGRKLSYHSDVVELMSGSFAPQEPSWGSKQEALRHCLDSLRSSHRRIFWLRYVDGKSVSDTAAEMGRSVESVKCLMLRVRRGLRQCIERAVAGMDSVALQRERAPVSGGSREPQGRESYGKKI